MLQVPALLSRTPSRSSPCPNVYTQEHLDVVIVDLAPVAAVALQGELRHGAQSGQARLGVHAAILEVCSDGDHLIQHAVCRGRGVLSNGLLLLGLSDSLAGLLVLQLSLALSGAPRGSGLLLGTAGYVSQALLQRKQMVNIPLTTVPRVAVITLTGTAGATAYTRLTC